MIQTTSWGTHLTDTPAAAIHSKHDTIVIHQPSKTGLIMIFKRLLIAYILFTPVTSAFCVTEDLLPRTIKYKLDLRIDYSDDKLYAGCELTILNDTDHPMEKIPVLLYRLLTVRSVENEDNITIPFTQKIVSISGWEKGQANFVEISPGELISPGEQRKIKITYEGYLLGYSETGWRCVKDHIDRNFTIIRTDGFGYPILGYPDEHNMWAIVKERYDYTINITVPSGMNAVTGGRLVDQIENENTTTFIYHSKKPSWRLDIAVSDYQIMEIQENRICY